MKTELEVDTSRLRSRDLARISRKIDELIAGARLTISMKGSVASFPGSIHWHLKRGRERGTLEITLLPDGRLWFSMHQNRSADWVMETARDFKRKIEGGI